MNVWSSEVIQFFDDDLLEAGRDLAGTSIDFVRCTSMHELLRHVLVT